MPSLMDIPRELRDQICIYAIHTPTAPPDLTQSFEQLVESRVQHRNPTLRAWSDIVLYPTNSQSLESTSLLLVNHQLHSETLSNLALVANPPTYSLDIILLDEILLLPTWTNLPTSSTHIDTVNVTLRISGSYDPQKQFNRKTKTKGPYARFNRYKGFAGGDGAGPAMSWQIYSVLERFIKAGPRGETESADTNRHFTAKCIRIDVQTPEGIAAEQFGLPVSRRYRGRNKEVEVHVLDPEYLSQFVKDDLNGLLGGYDSEWFSYGKILLEHLDEIVLCKDGVEFMRWDIAERLRDREVGTRYLSKEGIQKYKEETWKLRKARGLRVLDE
jgi:hypothetical protein